MNIVMLLRVLLVLVLTTTGCDRFNASLTRGLEEEKSYTRHAMEYHRAHPEKRRGDSVLETWSTLDYIAQAVAKQKLPGNWANTSDRLAFLAENLKRDSDGRPFCVVQRTESVIVISYFPGLKPDCTVEATANIDTSNIRSGDMQFSGRTDFWVYVLNLSTR